MNKKVKKNAGLTKKNSVAKTAENNSQVLASLMATEEVAQNQQIVEKHVVHSSVSAEVAVEQQDASLASVSNNQNEYSNEALEQIIATNWSEVTASDITLVADKKDENNDKGGILPNDTNGWGWLGGLGLLGAAAALAGGGGGGGSAPAPTPTASIALTGISGSSLNSSHHVVSSTTDVVVTGTVGGDVHNGDIVTLTVAGHTYTGTVTSGTFSITMTGAGAYMYAAGNGNITASVSTTTAGGTASANATPLAYVVDALPAPHITVGAIAVNDVISYAEGVTSNHSTASNITISGTVSGCANGDVVTLHYGNSQVATYTLTGLTSGAGAYAFTVSGADLYGASVESVSVSVSTGAAVGSGGGGVGTDTATHNYTVTLPVPVVAIDLLTGDGDINHADAAGHSVLTVTGHVTGDFKANDVITLQVGGAAFGDTGAGIHTYTAHVLADGTWSVDVSTTELEATTHVYAQVSVGSGAQTTIANANQTYTVHDAAYTGSIVIDEIAPDNGQNFVLETADASGNVHINGHVTGDFHVGDTVTLELDGVQLGSSVVVQSDGTFSVVVSGDILANSGSDHIVATVTRDDSNGAGTASTSADYTTDFGFNHFAFSVPVSANDVLSIDQSFIHHATVNLDTGTHIGAGTVSIDNSYAEEIFVNSNQLTQLDVHVYSRDAVHLNPIHLQSTSSDFTLNVNVDEQSTLRTSGNLIGGFDSVDALPSGATLNIHAGSGNGWGDISADGNLVAVSGDSLNVNLTASNWSSVENTGSNHNLIYVNGSDSHITVDAEDGSFIGADRSVVSVVGQDVHVTVTANGSASGDHSTIYAQNGSIVSLDGNHGTAFVHANNGATISVDSSDWEDGVISTANANSFDANGLNATVSAEDGSRIISHSYIVNNAYDGSVYTGDNTDIKVSASFDSYIWSGYDIVRNYAANGTISVDATTGSTISTDESVVNNQTHSWNSNDYQDVSVSANQSGHITAATDIVYNDQYDGYYVDQNITVTANHQSNGSYQNAQDGIWAGEDIVENYTEGNQDIAVVANNSSEICAGNDIVYSETYSSYSSDHQSIMVTASADSEICASGSIVEGYTNNTSYVTNVAVNSLNGSLVDAYNIVSFDGNNLAISVDAYNGSRINAVDDIVRTHTNNSGNNFMSYDAADAFHFGGWAIEPGVSVVSIHGSSIESQFGNAIHVYGNNDVALEAAVDGSLIYTNAGQTVVGNYDNLITLAGHDSTIVQYQDAINVTGNHNWISMGAFGSSEIIAGYDWWNNQATSLRGDLVQSVGSYNTINVSVENNSYAYASQNVINTSGNHNAVDINISYDSSLVLDGVNTWVDSAMFHSLHGNDNTFSLYANGSPYNSNNLPSAGGASAGFPGGSNDYYTVQLNNAAIADIKGSNNTVTLDMVANASLSADYGIYMDGTGSTVNISVDGYGFDQGRSSWVSNTHLSVNDGLVNLTHADGATVNYYSIGGGSVDIYGNYYTAHSSAWVNGDLINVSGNDVTVNFQTYGWSDVTSVDGSLINIYGHENLDGTWGHEIVNVNVSDWASLDINGDMVYVDQVNNSAINVALTNSADISVYGDLIHLVGTNPGMSTNGNNHINLSIDGIGGYNNGSGDGQLYVEGNVVEVDNDVGTQISVDVRAGEFTTPQTGDTETADSIVRFEGDFLQVNSSSHVDATINLVAGTSYWGSATAGLYNNWNSNGDVVQLYSSSYDTVTVNLDGGSFVGHNAGNAFISIDGYVANIDDSYSNNVIVNYNGVSQDWNQEYSINNGSDYNSVDINLNESYLYDLSVQVHGWNADYNQYWVNMTHSNIDNFYYSNGSWDTSSNSSNSLIMDVTSNSYIHDAYVTTSYDSYSYVDIRVSNSQVDYLETTTKFGSSTDLVLDIRDNRNGDDVYIQDYVYADSRLNISIDEAYGMTMHNDVNYSRMDMAIFNTDRSSYIYNHIYNNSEANIYINSGVDTRIDSDVSDSNMYVNVLSANTPEMHTNLENSYLGFDLRYNGTSSHIYADTWLVDGSSSHVYDYGTDEHGTMIWSNAGSAWVYSDNDVSLSTSAYITDYVIANRSDVGDYHYYNGDWGQWSGTMYHNFESNDRIVLDNSSNYAIRFVDAYGNPPNGGGDGNYEGGSGNAYWNDFTWWADNDSSASLNTDLVLTANYFDSGDWFAAINNSNLLSHYHDVFVLVKDGSNVELWQMDKTNAGHMIEQAVWDSSTTGLFFNGSNAFVGQDLFTNNTHLVL